MTDYRKKLSSLYSKSLVLSADLGRGREVYSSTFSIQTISLSYGCHDRKGSKTGDFQPALGKKECTPPSSALYIFFPVLITDNSYTGNRKKIHFNRDFLGRLRHCDRSFQGQLLVLQDSEVVP